MEYTDISSGKICSTTLQLESIWPLLYNDIPAASLGNASNIETTQICPDGVYWLAGAGPHNIFGDVQNNGCLTFSSPDGDKPLSVKWDGDFVYDGASLNSALQMNDVRRDKDGSSSYELTIGKLINEGVFQMCASGDNNKYKLKSTESMHNDGLITFEQDSLNNNADVSELGVESDTAYFLNTGNVKLSNIFMKAEGHVVGTGCFSLHENSALVFTESEFRGFASSSIWNAHNIYFDSNAKSSIAFEDKFLDLLDVLEATIYNFGKENTINFQSKIKSISLSDDGYLLVALEGSDSQKETEFKLKLNSGYNEAMFSIENQSKVNGVLSDFPNVLRYTGKIPSAVNPTCLIDTPSCQELPQSGQDISSSKPKLTKRASHLKKRKVYRRDDSFGPFDGSCAPMNIANQFSGTKTEITQPTEITEPNSWVSKSSTLVTIRDSVFVTLDSLKEMAGGLVDNYGIFKAYTSTSVGFTWSFGGSLFNNMLSFFVLQGKSASESYFNLDYLVNCGYILIKGKFVQFVFDIKEEFDNFGVISINGDEKSTMYWRYSSDEPLVIRQDGLVYLRNVDSRLKVDFAGSGCWTLDDDTLLYFTEMPNLGQSVFDGQSIYMKGQNVDIIFRDTRNISANLYNFGAGHKITFTPEVAGWYYLNDDPNLYIVMVDRTINQINIGLEYDRELFKYSKTTDGFHIAYEGNSPERPIPPLCLQKIPDF